MLTENPEEFNHRFDQKKGKAFKGVNILRNDEPLSCDEMSSDNDSVSEINENQFQ